MFFFLWYFESYCYDDLKCSSINVHKQKKQPVKYQSLAKILLYQIIRAVLGQRILFAFVS